MAKPKPPADDESTLLDEILKKEKPGFRPVKASAAPVQCQPEAQTPDHDEDPSTRPRRAAPVSAKPSVDTLPSPGVSRAASSILKNLGGRKPDADAASAPAPRSAAKPSAPGEEDDDLRITTIAKERNDKSVDEPQPTEQVVWSKKKKKIVFRSS